MSRLKKIDEIKAKLDANEIAIVKKGKKIEEVCDAPKGEISAKVDKLIAEVAELQKENSNLRAAYLSLSRKSQGSDFWEGI